MGQRIGNEVGRQLLKPAAVAQHGARRVDVDVELPIGVGLRKLRDDLTQGVSDVVDFFHRHREATAHAAPGKVQDVVHELERPGRTR